MTGLDLATIDRLTNGRLGTQDVPCPFCTPFKSPHGQRRKGHAGVAGGARLCHVPLRALWGERLRP